MIRSAVQAIFHRWAERITKQNALSHRQGVSFMDLKRRPRIN